MDKKKLEELRGIAEKAASEIPLGVMLAVEMSLEYKKREEDFRNTFTPAVVLELINNIGKQHEN